MQSFQKAKEQALRYLNYRPRTIKEVEDYLIKKHYELGIVEQVINYLLDMSYLNDELFCQLWIENRLKLKPMGKKRLFQELIQKGVATSVIDITLEQYFNINTEFQLALELAKKRIKKINYQDNKNIKRKISGFLYRRGFAISTINSVMEEVFKDYAY